jgi:bacteriocin biosynthesis cyclodehydratase domain-containing protein
MVLKLDPRLPLVWRTPTSIQLGVDAPPVRLDELSNAQERMIAALVAGISRSGLDMVARAAGAGKHDVDALLKAVSPALEEEKVDGQGAITIAGSGATAMRLAEILRQSGAQVVTDGGETGFAVIVAHYVIEPELHGYWLRRDIPHLPIVYGDTSVRVGPFVEPGLGPCLYCLELRRTDADPAWPTIASQLWGRSSTAESALVAGEVAALAARFVLRRRDTGPEMIARSIDLDIGTGTTVARRWSPHPECGCIEVDEKRHNTISGRARPGPVEISPARPGNGSVAALPREPNRPSPRTDAGGGALA